MPLQALTTAINKRNEKAAVGQAAHAGGRLKTVSLPSVKHKPVLYQDAAVPSVPRSLLQPVLLPCRCSPQ